MKIWITLVGVAAAAAALSGCINGAGLYADETIVWKATLLKADWRAPSSRNDVMSADWPKDREPYANAINYARNLAELYMEQASKASTAKDVMAAGLLGTAGVAAGGLMYGAHLDLIKGAGLAAGGITSSNSYLKPEEVENALLSASEALLCVAGVAQQGNASFYSSSEAADIVTDATLRIRLNVRKKLSRQVPDYSALVDRLKAGANVPKSKSDTPEVSSTDVLRVKTAECMLRSGA